MRRRFTHLVSGAVCLLFAAGVILSAKISTVRAEEGDTPAEETIAEEVSALTEPEAEEGTPENPLIILEIVPDRSMGMIGYLIPGQEPIDMEALSTDSGAFGTYKPFMIDSGLSSYQDTFRYTFDLPEEGELTEDKNAYGAWYKQSNKDSEESYTEYGYYQYEGDSKGAFAAGGEAEEPVFSYVGEGNGDYSFHMTGSYEYTAAGNGTHVRKGVWPDYTYTKQEGGNYQYMPAEAGEDEVPPDVFLRYRNEEHYYRYRYWKITNNDCLVKEVYEGKSTEDGFLSQVITLTPDQMTGENLKLVETADLIVISAQNYGVALWDALNKDHIEVTPEEQAARKTSFMGENGNDFSWELVMAIVNRMASLNPAAMYVEATQVMPENQTSCNAGKLYMMLMQYGAKAFSAAFLKDTEHFSVQDVKMNGRTVKTGVYQNPYNDNTYDKEWTNKTFETAFGIRAMHQSEFNRGDGGTEVFGTIMTYNGNRNMLVDYLKPTIPQTKPKETEDTKFGDNVEAFDYWEEKNAEGIRPDSITTSQGIHYILNHDKGTAPDRKKLRVLEIQPCNKFIYGSFGWQLYYQNLFPWFTGDLGEDLTVTPMTSYQFNSDTADLNSEYDLIVFGEYQDASNGLNGVQGYNDKNLSSGIWGKLPDGTDVLYGRIYTSVGDLAADPSSWTPDPLSEAAKQGKARYSGNDITKKKYEEIKDFLSASKPVIMPKKFFKKNSFAAAEEWIDRSSYIAKLQVLVNDGTKATVLFKEGFYYTNAGKNLLKPVLALEQCNMELLDAPQTYGVETKDAEAPGMIAKEIYHTQTDGSGRPLFCYRFTLTGMQDKRYGVRLYLDRDGDGNYAGAIKEQNGLTGAGRSPSELGSEAALGITVYEITEDGGKSIISSDELTAGKTYEISYALLEQERGILPWKLELFAQDNSAIRCSKTGYTAVQTLEGKKPKINVLQMNLSKDMKTDRAGTVNFADTATDTGKKFAAYLGAVEDYEVTLSFLKNTDWYAQYGMEGEYAGKCGITGDELKQLQKERWKEYLDGMDLLILGYEEEAEFTDDEIFYEGFLEFTDQGKGVILSNGIAKDPSIPDGKASVYDAGIRTLAGQREKYYVDGTNYYRYSKTAVNGSGLVSFLPEAGLLNSNKRYQSVAGTNIPDSETQDYTDPGASKTDGFYNDYAGEFMDNSTKLLLYYGKNQNVRDRSITENYEISWNGSAKYADWIRIANKGRITSYPYPISDVIKVSNPFAGSYRLSLEQEDGGDVTVWYNLTDGYDEMVDKKGTNGGIYSSRPGDSASHYYMYTKGNITYTGLGMSSDAKLTDDEIKLFVNTLFGAYRKIPEKPYIKITNPDAAFYEGTYTMYHLLTGAEEEDGRYEVDFTVCDEDLKAADIRTYTMCFKNADGTMQDEQPELFHADTGEQIAWNGEGYPVQRDGSYRFFVPYKTIKEKGKVPLYLELSSVYMRGNKEVQTKRVTRAVIYAMPLFDLN